MPAGRMYNATAAMRVKRRGRGTRVGRPAFRKAVSAIAKRVVLRQCETKTYSYSIANGIGSNGIIYSFFKQIAQGAAQNQRIGDRVKAMSLRLRGYLSIDNAVITSNEDSVACRVVFFSAKRPIASVTDSGLTYNSVVDPELLNVLSDRYVTFKKDGRSRWMQKYIKFPRVVSYNPTGSDPSKNELYLVIIPYSTMVTGLTTTTGMSFNTYAQLYWKDP